MCHWRRLGSANLGSQSRADRAGILEAGINQWCVIARIGGHGIIVVVRRRSAQSRQHGFEPLGAAFSGRFSGRCGQTKTSRRSGGWLGGLNFSRSGRSRGGCSRTIGEHRFEPRQALGGILASCVEQRRHALF